MRMRQRQARSQFACSLSYQPDDRLEFWLLLLVQDLARRLVEFESCFRGPSG